MKTKTLLNLGVSLIIVCLACEAAAQSPVALATRKAELQALSELLLQRDQRDRQQAQAYASQLGIPLRRELPNGKILKFQRIA